MCTVLYPCYLYHNMYKGIIATLVVTASLMFSLLILLCRWATLKAALVERRSKLGESKTIQQFSRDAEDIEAWVSEKLQTVLDESYKDPTNLQVRFSYV